MLSRRDVVRRQQRAAELRADAQRLEVVAGDELRDDALGIDAATEAGKDIIDAVRLSNDWSAALIVAIVGHRHADAAAIDGAAEHHRELTPNRGRRAAASGRGP